MAVSGVSPGSAASLQTNPQNDPRLLFLQLSQAINAGNLTGAQQAYSQLTQALGNNGGTSNSNDPFSQALNAIGQALQNKDIGGAQQALSQLQQQMQANRGHHHHAHHGGGGQASDNSPSQTGSGSTTTSTQSVGNTTNILDVTV